MRIGGTRPREWSTKKKNTAPRGLFKHAAGVWAVRYTCGLGHIHREKVAPSKDLAVKVYHARRARALESPTWCPKTERRQARLAKAAALTVKEYGAQWLKAREHGPNAVKPRTLDGYRNILTGHLFPTLGGVLLADLSRGQLRAWLATKKSLSKATQANLVIPVRALLNDAFDDGLIVKNPATRLLRATRGLTEKDARKVEALTREELATVLSTAADAFPEWLDFFRVLGWTGLRLGEACGLQWGDLDSRGGFLDVRRNIAYRKRKVLEGAPKSGQARRVDVPRVLVERLQVRRGIQEAEATLKGVTGSPWIFAAPTDASKPVNPAFVRFKVWYRLVKKAGLRALRLHSLRHTYASLLLQQGESIAYVSKQMGHSTITLTVDRYGHFVAGGNRQAVDRLAEATSAPNYSKTIPTPDSSSAR